MSDYRRASFETQTIDFASLSEERIQAMKAEGEEVYAHNQSVTRQRAEAYNQATALLRQALPRDYATISKYLKRYGFHTPSNPWEWLSRRIEEAKKKAEQERAIKVREEQAEALQGRAILWLQAKGKKLGEDFQVSNAIEVANGIAFEEEVAKRQAEGGLHSFSGEDSCENCGGWDGVSRRCECGNRRVSWESGWGHSFENPYIHAEAY